MKKLLLLLLLPLGMFGQISMTTSGSYSQDFNTLSTTGTGAWTDNSTISSWYWQKSAGGGSFNVAGTGSSTTGAGYSFGTGTSTERAMGSIGSGTPGNLAWGVQLKNTSGYSITDIKVSYTGEQWRDGGNNPAVSQTLAFYYKISSSSISALNPNLNSGWIAVTALDFVSPIYTTTAGALDGNNSANRTTYTNISIPCLDLKDNEYIMLKWDDPNNTGNDHGFGIDDVTISWTTAPVCNASSNVSLAGSNYTALKNYCTIDAGGWIYYSDKCNPNQLLFGIKKNGSVFDATVDITVGSTFSNQSSNGANQEHGMFLMGRSWNVNLTSGSISTPVDVRFFYDPTELTAAQTARNNAKSALPGSSLAVNSPASDVWFKSIGTNFSTSGIVGNKFPYSVQKFASPTISTLNGITYVELTGVTSFSGGTGGYSFGPPNSGGTNALPVTWAGFEVKMTDFGNELIWKTASEENTSHFIVESSTNGIDFKAISDHIKAAGTSKETLTYSYSDKNFAPITYYRIRQVDDEGLFDFSKIAVAKRNTQGNFNVNIYPTQIENQLKIEIDNKTELNTTVILSDMQGRVMSKLNTSETDINLNVSHIQKGIYQVVVINGDNKIVSKISK